MTISSHLTENTNNDYPLPKTPISSNMKHYGKTRDEQIKINQKGLEILHQWRKESESKTLEEKQEESANFALFQKNY